MAARVGHADLPDWFHPHCASNLSAGLEHNLFFHRVAGRHLHAWFGKHCLPPPPRHRTADRLPATPPPFTYPSLVTLRFQRDRFVRALHSVANQRGALLRNAAAHLGRFHLADTPFFRSMTVLRPHAPRG